MVFTSHLLTQLTTLKGLLSPSDYNKGSEDLHSLLRHGTQPETELHDNDSTARMKNHSK